MSATRRVMKCVALGLAVVTAALSTAGPAGAKTIRPSHAIYCSVTAYAPTQYYRGTIVTGKGNILCTTSPDVMNITVIIWRYDGNGKYTQLVHKTSNQTGSDVTVIAQAGCDYSRAFPMHTQVLLDAFHGTWSYDSANSQTVTMYC
jgi:hypothetical protein